MPGDLLLGRGLAVHLSLCCLARSGCALVQVILFERHPREPGRCLIHRRRSVQAEECVYVCVCECVWRRSGVCGGGGGQKHGSVSTVRATARAGVATAGNAAAIRAHVHEGGLSDTPSCPLVRRFNPVGALGRPLGGRVCCAVVRGACGCLRGRLTPGLLGGPHKHGGGSRRLGHGKGERGVLGEGYRNGDHPELSSIK